MTSADMACNTPHTPIPSAIAEVRAGSTVTFHCTRWLYSHKGPISAWMAPYKGSVDKVNVNKLQFFKIGEEAVDSKGVWGTVKLLDSTNGTWMTTIPADIKSGNYIIRHELIALHFALDTNPGCEWSPIGPQFYMHCFKFKYDIFNTTVPALPYPFVGPKVYTPSTAMPALAPKEKVVISPTGQGEAANKVYLEYQEKVLAAQSATTESFDAAGG
ncbi:glycosyl hydrolase family 61-domain-containing protein [Apodospora peruviana]|uniref:lytic cellulose monooxygenase (C4-dehydrogenating) n=1 Tax=Apodospora peruviana TaxID=516989 RepID=A0AAE0IL93_9PEZI|nr:glycosyl hydrolase family 61-domain-containing protein [Apodospora peruviana]